MFDFVKKTLSFGLGAALLTGEKLRQVADEAVARGEMSKDEAKTFIDDITQRAEEEKTNIETWMREQMRKMIREMGMVERSEFEALQKRLDAVESHSYDHEEIS